MFSASQNRYETRYRRASSWWEVRSALLEPEVAPFEPAPASDLATTA